MALALTVAAETAPPMLAGDAIQIRPFKSMRVPSLGAVDFVGALAAARLITWDTYKSRSSFLSRITVSLGVA